MLKKMLSLLFILCFLNFMSSPVFAIENLQDNAVIDDSVSIHEQDKKNVIVESEFITSLNVNKSSKGEVVQFKSLEDSTIEGLSIPRGTIFNGKVKSVKKGRWAYRRAKVRIALNEIILPNGDRYKVKGRTKKRVLKGSAAGNIVKGVVTLPLAVVTGVVGATVIIVETVSIAGLIIVGPTSYIFGETMGKLTHGVNCKKDEGDLIKLKIYSVKPEKITK